jgi:hypothetical protein
LPCFFLGASSCTSESAVTNNMVKKDRARICQGIMKDLNLFCDHVPPTFIVHPQEGAGVQGTIQDSGGSNKGIEYDIKQKENFSMF